MNKIPIAKKRTVNKIFEAIGIVFINADSDFFFWVYIYFSSVIFGIFFLKGLVIA